jgi:hypothetical protein
MSGTDGERRNPRPDDIFLPPGERIGDERAGLAT